VELNDWQFGALVSLCINIGAKAFTSSTLVKKLNGGDYDSVPRELMKWVNDNGKRVPGLVNRRARDAAFGPKALMGNLTHSESFLLMPRKLRQILPLVM